LILTKYLQAYYEKIRLKGENRLNQTYTTIKNLNKKLAKYSEQKEFKAEDNVNKTAAELYKFFSFKSTSDYPGKVLLS